MSLQNWLNNRWLEGHRTSAREIDELLAIADRDISDSQIPELSADWKMNIAYNAALQLATAALAASGYRAAREAHHYRIIQSLAYTINADTELITLFDRFRKKRNISGYDCVGMVSDHEANEMRDFAIRFRERITAWLREKHPDLVL